MDATPSQGMHRIENASRLDLLDSPGLCALLFGRVYGSTEA